MIYIRLLASKRRGQPEIIIIYSTDTYLEGEVSPNKFGRTSINTGCQFSFNNISELQFPVWCTRVEESCRCRCSSNKFSVLA
jgi:hypothetical protein